MWDVSWSIEVCNIYVAQLKQLTARTSTQAQALSRAALMSSLKPLYLSISKHHQDSKQEQDLLHQDDLNSIALIVLIQMNLGCLTTLPINFCTGRKLSFRFSELEKSMFSRFGISCFFIVFLCLQDLVFLVQNLQNLIVNRFFTFRRQSASCAWSSSEQEDFSWWSFQGIYVYRWLTKKVMMLIWTFAEVKKQRSLALQVGVVHTSENDDQS